MILMVQSIHLAATIFAGGLGRGTGREVVVSDNLDSSNPGVALAVRAPSLRGAIAYAKVKKATLVGLAWESVASSPRSARSPLGAESDCGRPGPRRGPPSGKGATPFLPRTSC